MIPQLLLHLLGDYILQSDWMAQNKRTSNSAAVIHAVVYSLPFALLTFHAPHPNTAWVIIYVTHAFIDRFGLARYLVFAKNFIAPRSSWPSWSDCSQTGYPSDRPAWLAVWLLIIADNTMHLCVNYAALRWG